ncbi:MAG: hypothetical protein HYY18_11095 [Planctomycetes bacterium]|nr:hypothetical protein [Planctomycetota bacterium]
MNTTDREDLMAWRDDARRAALKRQHAAHDRSCARHLQDLAAGMKAAEKSASTTGTAAGGQTSPKGPHTGTR